MKHQNTAVQQRKWYEKESLDSLFVINDYTDLIFSIFIILWQQRS